MPEEIEIPEEVTVDPQPEDFTPQSELTVLTLLRDQVQKVRISEGNRADAAVRLEQPDRERIHRNYESRLLTLEKDVTSDVETEMKNHPAWPWLEKIKGVGPLSAALVVGQIDITRCETISALWRYAGYGLIDGKIERPTKGEKLHYNVRLKTFVWRIIDLQVKHRGPYRRIYDTAKFTYSTTRPDWTAGHVEKAARRKAAKMWLSHLHTVWREAEGLPTREPFITENNPQHDYISPWKFLEES